MLLVVNPVGVADFSGSSDPEHPKAPPRMSNKAIPDTTRARVVWRTSAEGNPSVLYFLNAGGGTMRNKGQQRRSHLREQYIPAQ